MIKKIENFITRWQLYIYIAVAIFFLTACIAIHAANGLMLLPILGVVIIITANTVKGIIKMFKDIKDDEENNGAN